MSSSGLTACRTASSATASTDRGSREVPAPSVTPSMQQVFAAVLTHGPTTRVELGERTGLSSGAVTKAVKPLLDAGLLTEGEADLPGQRGRPARPLDVPATGAHVVGVKVTDTELIGVLTDLRAQVRASARRRLRSRSVGAVLDALEGLTARLLDDAGAPRSQVRRLALAVSGDIDTDGGTVRYSPFLRWKDVPLAELATARTGLPTVVDNDVRALAVAEQWFGEGRGLDTFALVTVGTGVGCAIVVGGRVVHGAHGVAGELGHVSVDPRGPRCHCGARGCVEAIAGERALLAGVAAAAGRPLTMPQALDAAHADLHGPVAEVFARAGEALGTAVAAMTNLVGPARIVITGEGLAAFDLFERRLRAAFDEHAFATARDCRLVVRPLGFETWAQGAAAMAVSGLVSAG